MNIHSIIKLRKVIRLMVQALEILNEIPEEDYAEAVIYAKKDVVAIKHVRDNLERGNLFMTIFFLRELIESVIEK